MKFSISAIQRNGIKSRMNSCVLNKACDPSIETIFRLFSKVKWRRDKYFDAMKINDSEMLQFFSFEISIFSVT